MFNCTSLIPFHTATVHVAFFLLPSRAVTVTLAVPSPTALTTPLFETLTTFSFDDVHFTALYDFLGAFTLALNFSEAPTARSRFFLLSVTFLTAFFTTLTLMLAVFFLFFTDTTLIVVVPTFLPFTIPFLDTVATFALLYL